MGREVKLNRKMRGLGPLLKQAKAQGVEITYTGNNHIRLRCPNGAIVITGLSISDKRALHSVVRDLRQRGGIDVLP